MHSNHTLQISNLNNAALQHYNLDMSLGATVKSQCFFNNNNELDNITWPGHIIKPGMPFWRDMASLVKSSINKDQLSNDILKLARVSEYQSIQSMHELAEKHCSGVNIEC